MKPHTHYRTLLIAGIISVPAIGLSWGKEGHQIVAHVAEARLTPNAKSKVDALLRQLDAESMADVALFLDDARRGGAKWRSFNLSFPNNWRWHFVNLPLDSTVYRLGDIGTHTEDAVQTIARMIRVLKGSGTQDDPSVGVALWSLIHVVGDLHQPLHCGCGYFTINRLPATNLVTSPNMIIGTAFDRGGNRLTTGSSNMHSVWDGRMVDSVMGRQDVLETASALGRKEFEMTQGDILTWPEKWAVESVAVSKKVYSPLRFLGASERDNEDSPTGKVITAKVTFANQVGTSRRRGRRVSDLTAYVGRYSDTARYQLARGGSRLADILNTIWP